MARILFLTQLLPYPLASGAKIRAYYVLRHLAAAGHTVTLLSFVRPDDRPEDIEHLASFLHRVHTVPVQRSLPRNAWALLSSLVAGQPAIIAREQNGAMRRLVEQQLASGGFDAVHADQIPMAQYGQLAPDSGAKRLLDQHNATFQILDRLARHEGNLAKRLFLWREARAFARYEAQICHRFDHVTFVTAEDRAALAAQMVQGALAGRSSVIPICVDTDAVQPVPPAAQPFRVTHVGTMFWPPNIEGLLWFVDHAWPQVRDQVPAARLTLIGKNPPERIEALGLRSDIDVLGYVEDLDPYLAETAAFVVPLRAAGGMRVKIVDGWCWGLPIVSTTIGAEGIDAHHEQQILIADSPADFARATQRLLNDPDLAGRLRANGRAWVEANYDWRQVYSQWDEVYDSL